MAATREEPPAQAGSVQAAAPSTEESREKAAPPTPADPRLAKLAEGFGTRFDSDVRKPYAEAVASLSRSYRENGLAGALSSAQAQANLPDAVAIKAEMDRIGGGGTVPPQDSPDTPAALKFLRNSYRLAVTRLENTANANAAPLYEIYVNALEAYVNELTKAGKLPQAQQVREFRQHIEKQRYRGVTRLLASAQAPFVNSLGMKFVPVPGTGVLMCIHETRNRDYGAFAESDGATVGPFWRKPVQDGVALGSLPDQPVVNLSWDDAKAFCDWLSRKEGRTYRMPSDREWSTAVGIAVQEEPEQSPVALSEKLKDQYPWGKAWPPPPGSGNYADSTYLAKFPESAAITSVSDGFATLAPVMSFEPNDLGIYDLAGNVWEWCEDWHTQSRNQHIARGGSWCASTPGNFAASYRSAASVRSNERGFRVVMEIQPSVK